MKTKVVFDKFRASYIIKVKYPFHRWKTLYSKRSNAAIDYTNLNHANDTLKYITRKYLKTYKRSYYLKYESKH